MKRLVSRNSFDKRRGYLGVYLQEGAPFVDALWNEAIDTQRATLRQALQDTGLQGTTGTQLRIDPIPGSTSGQWAGLKALGGTQAFYCAGLPVLWPETYCFELPGSREDQNRVYPIYLVVGIEDVDAIERPELDDPGLGLERGSFRERVSARISFEPLVSSERQLLLTVQGSYNENRNVLYRVELSRFDFAQARANLLWDDAGAAVTARVTERVVKGATVVKLSSTSGFDPESLVVFEDGGPDLDGQPPQRLPGVYKITKSIDASTIEVVLYNDEGVGQRTRELPTSSSSTGLLFELDPWQRSSAVELTKPAHIFEHCIEVEARQGWREGMLVRLFQAADSTTSTRASLEFVQADVAGNCVPGASTLEADEDRRITRVIRHAPACSDPASTEARTMTLRLDRPLSYEHALADPQAKRGACKVAVQRIIRARRYRGLLENVAIDQVDATTVPSSSMSSDYEAGGPVALPAGLTLRLSREADAPEASGSIDFGRGDGWTFAARADGWYEDCVFEPLEQSLRASVLLATLHSHRGAYTLVDQRPVPAACAHQGWLALIAEAADDIAARVDEPSAERASAITQNARRSERAQRELVSLISEFAGRQGDEVPPGLGDAQPVRVAVAALRASVQSVLQPDSPAALELSGLAAAMTRVARAVACSQCQQGDVDKRQTSPAHADRTEQDEAGSVSDASPREDSVPSQLGGEEPANDSVLTPVPPAEQQPSSAARDLTALPTSHMLEFRSVVRGGRKWAWDTLGDVPAASTFKRERERRLAEQVAALLDQTARIGQQASLSEGDVEHLTQQLDALWQASYKFQAPEAQVTLADAVALYKRRAAEQGEAGHV